MTVAPERPSLAPKHTRKTEAKRSDAMDEGIRIGLGDEVYEVRIGDLNALSERALRRQYGCSFTAMTQEFEADPGLDSIAAVVWLSRYINGETDLSYDEVALEINLEFFENATIEKTGPAEVGDSPEA